MNKQKENKGGREKVIAKVALRDTVLLARNS